MVYYEILLKTGTPPIGYTYCRYKCKFIQHEIHKKGFWKHGQSEILWYIERKDLYSLTKIWWHLNWSQFFLFHFCFSMRTVWCVGCWFPENTSDEFTSESPWKIKIWEIEKKRTHQASTDTDFRPRTVHADSGREFQDEFLLGEFYNHNLL